MKVYAKLVAARNILAGQSLKKSGHNKFAGYQYFELGDFLPEIQKIFAHVGLVDVISFTNDMATMNIYDTEDGSCVTFTSPMGSAQLKGCHEVQNIGAVETYQRRYLYVTALAIVEHDALDATTGGDAPEAKEKPSTGGAKVVPHESNPNDVLLVDSLLEIGAQFTSLEELKGMWKANQSQIDELKAKDKALYKRLVDGFTTLKNNFKEE